MPPIFRLTVGRKSEKLNHTPLSHITLELSKVTISSRIVTTGMQKLIGTEVRSTVVISRRRSSRRDWSLLLKDQGRPADSLSLEGDSHLDAVGDLNEGNAAVHPVILTVEGHRPLNFT